MRYATFNVLADAYIGYGDYSRVEPELLGTGARTQKLVQLVDSLEADVVGLQEVEEPLLDAFDKTGAWQTFWTKKTHGSQPDGCLTLVRPTITVREFSELPFHDESGHVMQLLKIGRTAFVNTHIKWAPDGSVSHAGVLQTTELLGQINKEHSAIVVGDCNDRPGGPVRHLIEQAEFHNICDGEPTALVDQEPVALDLLAVRGLAARRVARSFDIASIPNQECPSDHIPIVADVGL